MFCIDFSQLKVLLDLLHKVNFHKTSFMDVISIHTSKERDGSYVQCTCVSASFTNIRISYRMQLQYSNTLVLVLYLIG